MKFGETPIADAAGGLLVHRQRAGNRMLDKGHALTDADIEALREAGVATVTIARLEANDIGEDAAAAQIADAAIDPEIAESRIVKGAAFTGRVNFHAAVQGLVIVDTARIDALNRIHESITMATVPAFAPVDEKQMIATIKIIPYAAPREAVEACVKLASEGGPLIRVAPLRPSRAFLIQTRLSGTKASVLDKTTEAVRHRLAELGSTLVAEQRTGHATADVVAAIAEAQKTDFDLLMIIGASAIADRRDVIPAAIEQAGGTVQHFGMPVDPGNLLLLARNAKGVPVLGLPGCARSPKLNGFDWVLQRLLAGIPVSGRDIQGMGVGGLLMDIPSRPLPRAAAVAPPAVAKAPSIAAVILAAGRSSRMGAENKLLADVGGAPMVRRVAQTVLASQARPVIVVVGHQASRVRAAVQDLDVTFVENPDYADGLSTSLHRGLDALPETADGAVIALGDMPRVSAAEIDRLIAAYNPLEGRSICVPTVDGKRGNPVLWGRVFFPEMRQVVGDTGARKLIAANAEVVCEVPMSGDGVLTDIDEPAALAALRERMARVPSEVGS
jgi:molybdenum cofactor cytidylyltransferase